MRSLSVDMIMKNLRLEATVLSEQAGMRLDKVASKLFLDYSRARLQQWIETGELTLDGEVKKPKEKVLAGQRIKIETTLEAVIPWKAQAQVPITPIFEDDDILVVNKPPNLVVHPAAGHAEGTLVNAILHHAPVCEHLPRAGIIHRLDKDTSGLLIIAKSLPAHTHLIQAMQAREIKRLYQTLVQGTPMQEGTVDAPIGRHPKQRKKMAVVDNGKPAITHYKTLEHFEGFTLLQVQLETGRTHQIRVHMAHIHHPIIGDQTYAGRTKFPKHCADALKIALEQFKRQALHAWQLSLKHPITGEKLAFEASLPDDFAHLLTILRQT